jgi:hypothetical protein
MKFKLFLTLAFCFSTLSGCDKFFGNSVTETFDISDTYKELYVYDAINVVVSEDIDEARVTTGENLISDVIIDDNGDRLEIKIKDGVRILNATVKVELPYNASLSKVSLYDASDIECEVDAEEFVINMTDASNANLQGHAERLIINLDAASRIRKNIINKRYALSCDECEVSMSGASDAYLHCDGNINVIRFTGASNLHYTGNATITYTGGTPSTGSNIKNDVI